MRRCLGSGTKVKSPTKSSKGYKRTPAQIVCPVCKKKVEAWGGHNNIWILARH